MKHAMIFLLLMGALFAKHDASSLENALGELEGTSKNTLATTSVLLLMASVIALAAGAIVYLAKIRGIEKRESSWVAIAVALVAIGVAMLAGAAIGLATYVLMPWLLSQMLG